MDHWGEAVVVMSVCEMVRYTSYIRNRGQQLPSRGLTLNDSSPDIEAIAREGWRSTLAMTSGKTRRRSSDEGNGGKAKTWSAAIMQRRRMTSRDVPSRAAGREDEPAVNGRGIYRAKAAAKKGPRKCGRKALSTDRGMGMISWVVSCATDGSKWTHHQPQHETQSQGDTAGEGHEVFSRRTSGAAPYFARPIVKHPS
jgi:hypothetical protein